MKRSIAQVLGLPYTLLRRIDREPHGHRKPSVQKRESAASLRALWAIAARFPEALAE